jgi:hypothetical protein
MIAEGLLWFDDDARRPLIAKIADAITRYSERTGWRPTVCEAHPAQAEAVIAELARTAAKEARRRTAAKASATQTPGLPAGLRIMPNSTIRPNYFLIGIAAGEHPRKAITTQTSGAQRRAARTTTTPSAPAAPASHARAAKAPRAKAS